MVIGIDTSGSVCSVACADGDRLLCEFSTDHKKTHSEALVPMLDVMLDKCGLALEDADCIAVAKGPGSFTGLRIGAACAQGLGLAINKPVVGVSTLMALSYNLCYSSYLVCPIMDARRNEVYTAAYRFDGTEPFGTEVIEPVAIPLSELLLQLGDLGEPVVFLGDGVPVYRETIDREMGLSHEYAPAHLNMQRAASIAVIGQGLFLKSGGNPQEFSLTYLRRPQAERERLGL